MMPRDVEGDYASAGLLACVVLTKYVDHMPLFRLQKQSERWGTRLPRQMMADWIKITFEWLEPIYKQMHKELFLGDYLQCDETFSTI
jgi:transposase